jgi:hypothetical protein
MTGDLQFDRAESRLPEASAPACFACKKALDNVYYLAGKEKLCGPCRDAVLGHLTGGSRSARVWKAGLLGLLAAIAGGLVWAYVAVSWDTGLFGLLMIGLGYLVGIAVRKGTGGRGGRGYQVLALALTYLSVGTAYTGATFMSKVNRDANQTSRPEGAPNSGDSSKTGGGGLLSLPLIGILLLSLPVVAGMKSPITALFLAIALWEAWRMTRGVSAHLRGPFRLGGSLFPEKSPDG